MDATTDLCEEAFVNISHGTLRSSLMSVALANSVIVPPVVGVLLCSSRTVFGDALVLIRFSAGTLAEVSTIIAVVVAIDLESTALMLHAMDLQAVVLIDMLAITLVGVVPDIGVVVLAAADVTIWAAEMTALEFMPITSSGKALLL